MITAQKRYWMAPIGVVLVCAGLMLVALGNPSRFSIDREADAKIRWLVCSGFACTIIGIGLLWAVGRYTTNRMRPEKQRKTNTGVGIGLVLQLGGLLLLRAGEELALLGLLFVLLSLPVFVWGCMHYAEGKGHSKWVGVVGLVGIVGLIVLFVLPDQRQDGRSGETTDEEIASLTERLSELEEDKCEESR